VNSKFDAEVEKICGSLRNKSRNEPIVKLKQLRSVEPPPAIVPQGSQPADLQAMIDELRRNCSVASRIAALS